MVKLKILDIRENRYSLEDVKTKNNYVFHLDFYGLEKMPQVNDFLGFHEELLDTQYIEYSNAYQFGPLNKKYGRDVKDSGNVDCIALIIDNNKIYLKRFFG